MDILEKDKFCREQIKIENIEHRLYQIASKGKYFLRDTVLVKNIDISKYSYDQYYNFLKKYGIEAEIDDYKLGWDTIIQGYNIMEEYSYILTRYSENWNVNFLKSLKESEKSENCGLELCVEDEKTNFHPWIYEQIEKNNLDVNNQYTISVDNLDKPMEIYIYSDEEHRLVIPYTD